jgi:glycosyltransferase involved in cell wall biosynthesis/SAM-dependent methyltransferase
MDPDILVVSRMNELDDALAEKFQAVLTPHITSPAEGCEVHDQKMLLFGIYNLGFIALRNTEPVRDFVKWWERKLEKDCVIDLENGLFVDQKWMDLLPAFLDRVKILRHVGYNIAYWNLSQRQITHKQDQWLSNADPVRFVHFSGNKLDDEYAFSRHSGEFNRDNIGDLASLLDTYKKLVYDHGHSHYSSLKYAYSWVGEKGVNLHAPEPDIEEPKATRESIENETVVLEEQAAGELVPDASAGMTCAESTNGVKSFRSMLFNYTEKASGWVPLTRKIISKYKEGGMPLVLEHYRRRIARGNRVFSYDPFLDKERRILFVESSTPKPDRDAGSLTAYNLLRIFIALGYEVTMIPSDLKRDEHYSGMYEQMGVKCLYQEDVESLQNYIQHYGSQHDYYFICRAPIAGLYLDFVRQYAPQATFILNTVDLHYLRESRGSEVADADSNLEYLESLKQQELDVISRSDISIVLSHAEEDELIKENVQADIRCIPLVIVDVVPGTPGYKNRQTVVFIGGFPHIPNIDAVLYFYQQVWPHVLKELPNAEFVVVGDSPPEQIQALDGKNQTIVKGFVKDIDPIFDEARLSVAPLRFGAGIKGKIGTSLSYGVPVVATTIAAEGMPLVDGKSVVVADDPEEFASRLVKLYTDPDLWEQLSENGKQVVQREYSTQTAMLRVAKLLESRKRTDQSLTFDEIYSIDEFRTGPQLNREKYDDIEYRLIDWEHDAFQLDGYCAVCGTESTFNVGFMYSVAQDEQGRPIPNWREHLNCIHCGFVNRVRAAFHYFYNEMGPRRHSRIYMTERVTALYERLERDFVYLTGSEYMGENYASGKIVDGILHQDMMNLSLKDNSQDYILSFDVLEHVPDYFSALRECFRCLAPGGQLLFSAPFSSDQYDNIIRARLHPNGEIEHFLPPEYHGNPVDMEQGALCYRYYGWEVLDNLYKIGFVDCRAIVYWSREQGYLGGNQFLFAARKPFENT